MDLVDDMKEADGISTALETITYLSCWTEDDEESIPMWKMYTPDLAGVRITLPKQPFKEFHYKAGDSINLGFKFANFYQDAKFLMPIEEIMTQNYQCFSIGDAKELYGPAFFKRIDYRDDYKDIYSKMVQHDITTGSTTFDGLFDV